MQNSASRQLAWGGFLTGFALGGFFDGILLHQILQWHHLLAGVAPTETAADLRFQVLADGLFHLLHYVFALIGVALLWRARKSAAAPGAGHRLIGWALLGFGAWHVIDGVVSHWVLQIHRIRMDVENLLFWDLLWFVPFGVVAVLAGAWILRRHPPGGDDGGTPRPRRQPAHGGRVVTMMALAALVAGPVAALPPPGAQDDMTLVVFRPGTGFADVVDAADSVDGRLVWTDQSHGVWLIALGPDANANRLYRHGALMVSTGAFAVGCLSWSQI